eukprot:Hpha_TRINITY_DN14358_c0_g2::TRINITY_DN14358_c0_g2_i4::g.86997::m.86997/K00827/AGXT2; alanine-glyoxylate transaminase / (R)-3-amino-2-methylpropionate-pyruvate transaminase
MRRFAPRRLLPSGARGSAQIPPTPHTPPPYAGLDYDKAVELRKRYVAPTPRLWYEDTSPVMLVEGKMQWLWDHKGKRYLDLYGGIVTVSAGHAHPKVNDAVKKQMDRIQHTTSLYLHPLQGEYAEAVVKHFPSEHEWMIYFTNSGSEANDLAMLIARTYTGNQEYITMRNCYHGMTEGTRGLTAARGWKWPSPAGVNVKHAVHASKYRGLLEAPQDACDTCATTGQCVCEKYNDELKGLIAETTTTKVAGWLSEPIQGVGGVYETHPGYLPRVYKTVRDHGGVCVSDEVQTGWGRLGTDFWGFEYAGVVPDIAVAAKSVANGWPVGLVVMRREIGESLRGLTTFNTYGGNPACLAAGLATLRVIEEEGLQENCRLRGEEMREGFLKLEKKYDLIGDVRGRGLFQAIELVSDRKKKYDLIGDVRGRGLFQAIELVSDRKKK